MTDIRTVLFDLDGTLADTAPDLAFALNRLLEEEDRAPLPYAAIRAEVSHGSSALIRLGFRPPPKDARFERLRQRLLEIYQQNLCVKTRLFPGIPEVLEQVQKRGLNWGIVTNKPAYLTDPLIARLGLARQAACVISGDTTNQRKPHPEPMLHACRLAASTPEQCLYVGDAERDIQAGKVSGMKTMVVLFGYIREDDNPMQWAADGVVRTPAGILDWLDAHA